VGIAARRAALLLFAWVLCAAGCGYGEAVEVEKPPRGPRATVPFAAFERDDWLKIPVDILVVVDSSAGMEREQGILARDFFVLLGELLDPAVSEESPSSYPPVSDLHVGVISADLGAGGYAVQSCEDDPMFGDDGILQHAPRGEGCDPVYPPFLSYRADERDPPDPEAIEKLSQDFGCIARIGTGGCGFEQPLEASYRALVYHSVTGGVNAGFLRRDSLLAVLFLTSEDDCSVSDMTMFDIAAVPYSLGMRCLYEQQKLFPVQRYASMFRELRPDSDRLAVVMAVGVPHGEECCSGPGDLLEGCLGLDSMQVAESLSGNPVPACTFPDGCRLPEPPYPGDCLAAAHPARRFVELARLLGPAAHVASVCTDSIAPALGDLAAMIRQKLAGGSHNPELRFVKAGDWTGCLCELRCTIMEELPAGGECGEGKIPYDDGSGRILCVIAQVGSVLESCRMACDDPAAVFGPGEGAGWWYDPNGPGGPALEFIGVVPEEGALLRVVCE